MSEALFIDLAKFPCLSIDLFKFIRQIPIRSIYDVIYPQSYVYNSWLLSSCRAPKEFSSRRFIS